MQPTDLLAIMTFGAGAVRVKQDFTGTAVGDRRTGCENEGRVAAAQPSAGAVVDAWQI